MEAESKMIVARSVSVCVWEEWGDVGQRVQTFSYAR